MSFAEAVDHLDAEETKIGIVVASHITELLQDLGGVKRLGGVPGDGSGVGVFGVQEATLLGQLDTVAL